MRTLAYDGSLVPEPTCPTWCWEPLCDLSRESMQDGTIGQDISHYSQPRRVIVPDAMADHRVTVSIHTADSLKMKHPREWVREKPIACLVTESTFYRPQDPNWRPKWGNGDGIYMSLADLEQHIAGLQQVRDELATLSIPEQRDGEAA